MHIRLSSFTQSPVQFLVSLNITLGSQKPKGFSYWKYLSGYHALSLDAYRADFLYKQLSRYYKRNKCETGNFSAALIGHPKLVTDKYIENMKRLIQMIKSDTRFNLCNIYEVYKNKSLKRG